MKKISFLVPIFILIPILTAGFWLTPTWQSILIPPCVWKGFFHFDCPGCGLTRSFIALTQGHILQAFKFNAAGPLLYLALMFYLVYWWAKLFGKTISLPKKLTYSFSNLLIVVLIGHWFYRLFFQVFY